jgi:Fe-Mn family superoxide dismutase
MNPTSSSSAYTRREAIKVFGAGAAMIGLSALTAKAADGNPAAPIPGGAQVAGTPSDSLIGAPLKPAGAGATTQPFVLPLLGYAYDALEPHIDARTMQIHYTKHHQAYITNANKALADHPELHSLTGEAILANLAGVPESIRTTLRNNVGGHVNHSFFWRILDPTRTPDAKNTGALQQAIATTFGSADAFKTQFTAAAMKQFGSGWAWLSLKNGTLAVQGTPNQDSPLSTGATPIIGLDVWEHAYYLKHQNVRADYVAAFWEVLNWQQAEANYAAAVTS